MASADVIIVGGGLIGLLTARELALAGLRVQLVERGSIGRESSWAGGGILSPLYPWRYRDAVTELARWSQARYPALAEALHEETGVDPEWTCSGLLMLNCDAERDEAVSWAASFGYELESVEGRETLHRLEPGLSEAASSGLWMPEVAQLRNPRLLQAVRKSLERLGVDIREQCQVTGFLHASGHIRGVETTDGELAADQVVVAGGAWSGELLSGLGIELPVHPVRGQMLLYKARPDLVRRIVLSQDRYVIPRRDGRILVGSTLEEVGFEKQTTREARTELEGEARRIIPALSDYPVEKHWAGLRPASPHGVPFIGPHPEIDGLYVNTGHFRNGVVTGLASVHLLADEVLGRPPILDPAPYRLER